MLNMFILPICFIKIVKKRKFENFINRLQVLTVPKKLYLNTLVMQEKVGGKEEGVLAVRYFPIRHTNN